MADGLQSLVQDPGFAQLSPQDQRRALVRADSSFANLSDAQIATFTQRARGGAATTTAPQAQAAPSFGQELYNQNIAPLVQMAQRVYSAPMGPQRLLTGAATALDAVRSAFDAQAEQGQATFDALMGNGPQYGNMTPLERASEAFGHGLAAVTPVVGPAAAHAAGNIGAGRYAAGAADLVGLGAQVAGDDVAEGAGRPLAAAAEGMYRRAVPFRKAQLSLQDIHDAAAYGLSEGLPRTESSVKALGSVSSPGTILGDLNRSVEDALNSGGRGTQHVNLATVTKPLEDAISKASADKTTEGAAYVKALQDELDSWKNGNQTLDAYGAQAQKRAMYDRIADSQYADNSTAIPSAARSAKELLARGLKNSIEEVVPEVGPLNSKMSTAMDLRTALTDAAKHAPSNFKSQLTWALGASAATTLALGHEAAGLTGLTATAVKMALDNPGIASRLAIAFHDSPQVLRALGTTGQAGAVAGQAAGAQRPTSTWPIVRLQPPQ